MTLIIAIDGPAGAGKSTLAKRLAAHYGLFFLDTGLLYRAVARVLMDLGEAPDSEEAAVAVSERLKLEDLDPERLYGEGIGNRASIAAAIPAVRKALLPVQRRLAAEGKGSVVAGRDIGSVVLPDADVKFYVTASLDVRVERRLRDLQERGESPTHDQVLAELIERDRRDEERAVAPLVVPEDAVKIDTSAMDIDVVLTCMIEAVGAVKNAK